MRTFENWWKQYDPQGALDEAHKSTARLAWDARGKEDAQETEHGDLELLDKLNGILTSANAIASKLRREDA